jgi:hypothetical protein
MEVSGISPTNAGFSQLEISQDKDFSTEIGKEKVLSLNQSIGEIKNLIGERENLSTEVFQEGEKIKTEINNFLLENQGKVSEEARDSVREKNDLRHKKIEISEFQLNERINCWKDVALLKKELRINEMELNEKQERMKVMAGLLEDN